MSYQIIPLHLGTITRKKSNMIYHCGSDEPTKFPLLSFLLKGNGHKILVDTGGSDPDGQKWMPYERPEDQRLEAQLMRHGVAPQEIDCVFFTHLHWDHAGGNSCLKHAVFYVQRKEYEAIRIEDLPGCERSLVLASQYELLDGDQEQILPGISVLLTPGHSLGSQTILAETSSGLCALAGDLIPTFENIESGLPNGGNYDIDVITDSMKRVCALNASIIPGHEPSFVQCAVPLKGLH